MRHGDSRERVRRSSRWWLSAAGLPLLAVVGLAGCGGSPTAALRPGTTASSAAPVALHVLSVTPRALRADSPLTVTYDSTLTATSPLPTLSPAVPGSWARSGSTAVFTPAQAYPPDTRLTVRAARLPGRPAKVVGHRTSPSGSLLAAQQALARLGYLPLRTTAPAPTDAVAQAAAVYAPPAGRFSWRWPDVPDTLRHGWTPAKANDVMRGAVIAFQHHAGLPMDGFVGQHTWQALIAADAAHQTDPDPYSYVFADLHVPQRLSVWVAGRTTLTTPVNGGVAGAPTPLGTFPVYDRYTSTTMSGTNPDGSHYSDPGVPWVSYFSGGSAVHGFPRASYGSPQSVGCLELPIATAKQVYGMIGFGTLVTVTGPAESTTGGAAPAAPHSSPSTAASPSPSHSAHPSPSASRRAAH